MFNINVVTSKLVRQNHVLEDASKRTFTEVKSNLPEYSDAGVAVYGNEPMMFNEHSFLEVDEEEPYEAPVYKNNYSASDSKVRYDDEERKSRPRAPTGPSVRSAESFLNDGLPVYVQPDHQYGSVVPVVVGAPANSGGAVRRGTVMRRPSIEMVQSADLVAAVGSFEDEQHRRKPEAMRSISEDVPSRVSNKGVTRRSLSHPENDSQVGVLMIVLIHLNNEYIANAQHTLKRADIPKIPSPKPLSDMLERSKSLRPTKIPSPRRKQYKSFDQCDESQTGNQRTTDFFG